MQYNYSGPKRGRPGLVADSGMNKYATSKLYVGSLTDAAGKVTQYPIPIGSVVIQDDKAQDKVNFPTADADLANIAGILMSAPSEYENQWGPNGQRNWIYNAQHTGDGTPGNPFGNLPNVPMYNAGDLAPVLRNGRVWVRVESPVTSINSPVYVRTAAQGDKTMRGVLAGAAGTGLAVAPSRLRWVCISDADNLAIVEINLP